MCYSFLHHSSQLWSRCRWWHNLFSFINPHHSFDEDLNSDATGNLISDEMFSVIIIWHNFYQDLGDDTTLHFINPHHNFCSRFRQWTTKINNMWSRQWLQLPSVQSWCMLLFCFIIPQHNFGQDLDDGTTLSFINRHHIFDEDLDDAIWNLIRVIEIMETKLIAICGRKVNTCYSFLHHSSQLS